MQLWMEKLWFTEIQRSPRMVNMRPSFDFYRSRQVGLCCVRLEVTSGSAKFSKIGGSIHLSMHVTSDCLSLWWSSEHHHEHLRTSSLTRWYRIRRLIFLITFSSHNKSIRGILPLLFNGFSLLTVLSLPFVLRDDLGEYHFNLSGRVIRFFPACGPGEYDCAYADKVTRNTDGIEYCFQSGELPIFLLENRTPVSRKISIEHLADISKAIPLAYSRVERLKSEIVAKAYRRVRSVSPRCGGTPLTKPLPKSFTLKSFYEYGQKFLGFILEDIREWLDTRGYPWDIELKSTFPYLSLMLDRTKITGCPSILSCRMDRIQIPTEDQVALDPIYLIVQEGVPKIENLGPDFITPKTI